MKKRFFILSALFIFISFVAKSQDYKYIYYLDESLGSVEKTKAVVLGKGLKDDGLFRLDCFDISGDKLLMSLHFTDSSLSSLEGSFSSYHLNGKIEKQGDYINAVEEGVWQKWDSLGNKTDSSIYRKGNLLVLANFAYSGKSGKIYSYTLKDYSQDTLYSIFYNPEYVISTEVFFKGNKGVEKKYTATGVTIDSLFTREEIEAEFPGGKEGWTDYLRKNLDANVPVKKGASTGTYQVIVRFIVSKDGAISDILGETNHGFGMEKEVIRMVKNSPKWLPASQYGRKVNAYRRQPVTFVVQ